MTPKVEIGVREIYGTHLAYIKCQGEVNSQNMIRFLESQDKLFDVWCPKRIIDIRNTKLNVTAAEVIQVANRINTEPSSHEVRVIVVEDPPATALMMILKMKAKGVNIHICASIQRARNLLGFGQTPVKELLPERIDEITLCED